MCLVPNRRHKSVGSIILIETSNTCVRVCLEVENFFPPTFRWIISVPVLWGGDPDIAPAPKSTALQLGSICNTDC